MSKILIVEDDTNISTLLQYNLEQEGYEVSSCLRGDEALERIRKENFDLVLLDLMLPGMSGLEICRNIKSEAMAHQPAVIMLTAKTEEMDIVVGLELGADDYMTKPFSPRILLARVKALLRRNEKAPEQLEKSLKLGPILIDLEKHKAYLGGEILSLTITEFKLLNCLLEKPGKVFSRDDLLNYARDEDTIVIDRTIDVHIRSLRKKMGNHRDLIETVRGVGYCLMENDSE